MHVRGSHAGAARDEVNRAWLRANHADLQLHSKYGRLMTGGDWNAEPAAARDPAARAYSNDIALQDFEAGSGLRRLGALEPTYVHEKGESVIDHVYVSPAIARTGRGKGGEASPTRGARSRASGGLGPAARGVLGSARARGQRLAMAAARHGDVGVQ